MEPKRIFDILHYKSKIHRLLLHLAFWLILITGLVIFQFYAQENHDFSRVIAFDIASFLVDIGFAYIFLYYIDNLLLKKRYILFIALILFTLACEIVAYLLVWRLKIRIYYPEEDFETLANSISIIFTTYAILIPIFSISFLHLLRKWILSQAEIAEVLNKNLQNELNLLKTQINQHFLFNTLNNIDAMIYKDPDQASRSLINLSKLLRYSIYETSDEVVPMFQELEYFENYLELFSSRTKIKNIICFDIIGDFSKISIAPMLFIPFLENAIKHGDISDRQPFKTSFKFDEKRIEFRGENKKRTFAVKNSDGLGLKNVTRRLELLYPDRHLLEIESDDDYFKIYLRIDT
mgnify:CR=1 FL=1